MHKHKSQGQFKIKPLICLDSAEASVSPRFVAEPITTWKADESGSMSATPRCGDSPRTGVFKKMFCVMDTNGDGSIDAEEGMAIGRVLCGGDVAAGTRWWTAMLSEADHDGSGTVSIEEYLSFAREKTKDSPAREVVAKFQIDLARLEESASRKQQQSHRRVMLDQRTKAERVFKYLDADNSGTLRLGELLKLAKSDEAHFEDLPQIFLMLDMDGFKRGDGLLTLDEWMSMAESEPAMCDEAFGHALLAVLERNVNRSTEALPPSGSLDREAHAKALFARLDLSDDGRLDMSEFLKSSTNVVRPGDQVDEEAVDEARSEFMWLDTVLDGHLSFDEFVTGLRVCMRMCMCMCAYACAPLMSL